ncbi:MAG: hypothetical protein K2P81_00790 [Bacteriovoracaceae bacterium]|nr:hypothetical protein [Bacteriovoracaceae bacterium]
MKLLTLALSLMITHSAIASVAQDVKALGNLAFGSDVTAVKGKDAKEIFEAFLNEGEELVFKEIDDMDYGDEIDEGFTSLQSAKRMGEFAEGVYEEQLEQAEDADRRALEATRLSLKRGWAGLINKLHQQGVQFGYTGHGPGYCGVSFIELIIIDAKAQKVYEVYLSQGGEC